jgi:predicted RecA/RadA family phage recombinase
MALAVFLHEGQFIDYTASADKVCGDVIELGSNDFIGIVATADGIKNGATGAVQIEGVFDCTKTTASDVLAAGDWLAFGAGGTVAASGTGRHLAVTAAGNGVTTIKVKINAR